jgi:hypothetical protein
MKTVNAGGILLPKLVHPVSYEGIGSEIFQPLNNDPYGSKSIKIYLMA